MGLGDLLFKLHKLTIEAYKEEARGLSSRIGRPIEVQYNPETLSLRHEATFQSKQASGPQAKTGKWAHNPPKRVTVNLVVDGTHADSLGIELLLSPKTVAERIQEIVSACCEPQTEAHEPAYLILKWQNGVLGPDGFKCRMASLDINYKSFDRDGSPLHAELSCAFVENLDKPKKPFNSPDVTHRVVVKDGDTLPLLCREIYGSAAHYL